MSQPQQFSTNSHRATTFLRRLTPERISLRSSNRLSLYWTFSKVKGKVKVTLRWIVSRLICLGVRPPSGVHGQIFITVRDLRICYFGTLCLSEERVCSLQLLLDLASAVILWFKSPRTHDRTLPPQIWDPPIHISKWKLYYNRRSVGSFSIVLPLGTCTKHSFSVGYSGHCLSTAVVCRVIIQQRMVYSCLVSSRCLASDISQYHLLDVVPFN